MTTTSKMIGRNQSGKLLPANARRADLIIDNRTDATLYLYFGTADASSTRFSIAVPNATRYHAQLPIPSQVMAAWATAPTSGAASVVEVLQ